VEITSEYQCPDRGPSFVSGVRARSLIHLTPSDVGGFFADPEGFIVKPENVSEFYLCWRCHRQHEKEISYRVVKFAKVLIITMEVQLTRDIGVPRELPREFQITPRVETWPILTYRLRTYVRRTGGAGGGHCVAVALTARGTRTINDACVQEGRGGASDKVSDFIRIAFYVLEGEAPMLAE
jgi:ubiquitin C-terminal hydrolase